MATKPNPMIKIYANRIEAGDYDYNSTATAYVRLKEQITAQMLDDAYTGRNGMTIEKFEEITGITVEVDPEYVPIDPELSEV